MTDKEQVMEIVIELLTKLEEKERIKTLEMVYNLYKREYEMGTMTDAERRFYYGGPR